MHQVQQNITTDNIISPVATKSDTSSCATSSNVGDTDLIEGLLNNDASVSASLMLKENETILKTNVDETQNSDIIIESNGIEESPSQIKPVEIMSSDITDSPLKKEQDQEDGNGDFDDIFKFYEDMLSSKWK